MSRTTAPLFPYIVELRDGRAVRVRAPHWLGALDCGLNELDVPPPCGRIVAERLVNGTMILRDLDTGMRIAVRLEFEVDAAA